MIGFLEEKGTGMRVDLGDTLVIGRKDDCHLVIQDAKISRQHAMIRKQDDGFWIYDLGSSNGCFLNDMRIINAEKLANNDTIRLGSHYYRFLTGEISVERPAMDEQDLCVTIADIRTVPVIMLVSDIKGFTKLSERLEPGVLAKAIGGWYRECNKVLVGEFGATIDKFIGDSVLAYWQGTSPEARKKAILAARRLREATDAIILQEKEELPSLDIPLDTGIGLHLGSVAHGSMSQGTFTLLGDAVNVTFRLEALTRKLGKNIVVSGEFMAGWNEGAPYVHSEGLHEVKGRATPLDVYSVTSWPS
jgi:adenylate cyclase